MHLPAGRSPARSLVASGPGKGFPARTEPTRAVRVLVAAARFSPDLGGTETHIYEVTKRMAKRGDLDLTILTTDRSGTRPAWEEFDGFTVRRCRAYPKNRDYYFAPTVYRQIINGHFDLLHCQGIHTAVPIFAMLAARRKRIPYVVSLHTGGHSSDFRHRLRNKQWQALTPLLSGAQVIVATSRFEQRLFRQVCSLDAAQFQIVPNGGDLPGLMAPVQPIPGRIVSCGRLERYKGHQRVIEALPIVRQLVPGATLRILGSGPYESDLRSLVARLGLEEAVSIDYIAPDDRERMSESLSRAAVVAALSVYESYPLAIAEALALGIPAIGLDTAGMGDLVADGLVTGVPAGASPAVVAQALVAAMQGQRANTSAGLPSWDDAAARLAQIYLSTAGAAAQPCRS